MYKKIAELISRPERIIRLILNQGHQRTVRAKKQIFASFLIKGCSIVIGFFTVPITLGYIEKEQYGIWITLSSIVAWFGFFDIGLGNGLRNKLAESLAENDLDKAKGYISSTYAILFLIFAAVLGVFFIVNPFLNWPSILNASPQQAGELRLVAIIIFSFFCINFVLGIIRSILFADQRPARTGFLNLVSNFISLLIIILLTRTTEGSLTFLALAVGLTPLVILAMASIFFFRSEYKAIAPSIKYVKPKYFKDLVSLGVKFFVVGITGIVIFSTDNMIITQLYGPAAVPAYSVAFKYFELVTSLFAIISVPFWSAYTEAYHKNDMPWIISTNKTLMKIWGAMSVASVGMLLISGWFYKIWVPEIEVPFALSFFMCLYVICLTWGNIFVVFINGIGKVQLQLIVSVFGALLNIPLSYFFAKVVGLGVAGVILASTISIAYGPILAPIQFHKFIKGNPKGIWNR